MRAQVDPEGAHANHHQDQTCLSDRSSNSGFTYSLTR